MDLDAIVKSLEVPAPPEVLVGITTADDAGVYRLAPGINLVMTADFITPACEDPFLYGQIAAANSISDVYAMGGTPKVALNLCCFPHKGIAKNDLTEILKGGLATIAEADAVLIGGHTVKDDELKYGLSVTGVVRDEDLTPNSGAKPGDVLILTKPIGTGVIVTARRANRIAESAARPVFERMAELNRTACEQMNAVGVNGATDVTGFGLGGHAWEMASASKVGIRFHFSKVPRWPQSEELIDAGIRTGVTLANGRSLEERIHFDPSLPAQRQLIFFDPQTSGGLLISVPEAKSGELLRRLIESGIADAAICGEVYTSDRPHIEVVP